MPIYEQPGPKFKDRKHAGKVLASELMDYRSQDLVVLAIPNGGVPVAAVIAEELEAELHLMIVRKLQIPNNPEAGFGALTSDGFLLLNQALINNLGLNEEDILKQKEKALKSIRSRQAYFGKRAEPPSLQDRTAVLVDDGLASGFTMEAAIKSAKSQGAKQIIIAVPTSSMTAYRRIESEANKIICPDLSRLRIFAVANAYQNWYDLEEKETLAILENLPRKVEKTTFNKFSSRTEQ
jgi:predicted phosphoribosyltransferase